MANTLVPGAQVSVVVNGQGQATIINFVLPEAAQQANTVAQFSTQWQTLSQALATLQAQNPANAAALKNNLPVLANLLPGLLRFAESLRERDASPLVGKDTSILLKSMGFDVNADIQNLSHIFQKTETAEWRGMLFPYLETPESNPQQGRFFWRREQSDNPRANTSTRFVVELSLSAMGALQLDGLVNYPEIWLKLRRHTQPEEGFTEGMQTLVAGFLASFGLKGGISVETTPSFPINPAATWLNNTPAPLPQSA